MKIYSMTATFGKLDHETLTLKPGLNVIHAPNEWGKSTWCAFLVAMLYGLETRTHSTKTVLSDKEHYTPWSGAPISGSIDLCWQGRDITIQRKTKGRSIFGDFRAFETHSGLPVPELTAANCGAMLLGVEKSVFSRSAFIRQADLPVTQDDALRHRLNALVTTGDDSGTAEALEKKLKDLRNRCRYNKTGLLPQTELEAAELERKLRELDSLHEQAQALRSRETALEQQIAALENHRVALAYAKSREDALHVVQARDAQEQLHKRVQELETHCKGQPTRAQIRTELSALEKLQDRWAQLHGQPLPAAPEAPDTPAPFRGMTPEEAARQLEQDQAAYRRLTGRMPLLWLIPGIAALGIGVWLLLASTDWLIAGCILLAAGLLLCVLGPAGMIRGGKLASAIQNRYGSENPEDWRRLFECYVNRQIQYSQAQSAYEEALEARQALHNRLQADTQSLCGDRSPAARQQELTQALSRWYALEDARNDLDRAQRHTAALESMATVAPAPAAPDPLTLSEPETARLLAEAAVQLRQIHSRLGQCQGQMESIGQQSVLETRLAAARQKIAQLTDVYAAATVALEKLQQARTELQRRFAPKITRNAQAILERLTGGRYDRLLLDQDLNLHAAAQSEDTLRAALWRSDGTTDQLYLALRLAVADALIPEAPLILDDALVRFDDRRLGFAMDLLKDFAQSRQVILFSCHTREAEHA